jgi:hypothetical protein
VWINSAGGPGSIHFVPNIAPADKPARTPLRETTTRLLVHAEQPKARRHVGCARRG